MQNTAKVMNVDPAIALTRDTLAVILVSDKQESDEFDTSVSVLYSSEKLVGAQQVDVEDCLSAGNPADCLTKPLGVEALRKCLALAQCWPDEFE